MNDVHASVLGRRMQQQRNSEERDGFEPGSAAVTPEALLLAERRLRDVIDGAQVGTWTWDFDSVGQIVNDVWAAMLGYDLKEMPLITYETWSRLIHPDDKEWVEAELRLCTSGVNDSYEAEYRMRHRKGHWIWVLDRARVVRRKADGKPKVMAGIQIEISEMKSREAALMRAKADLEKALAQRASAEQRFSDIAAVTDGWLWEIDQDMRFSFLSGSEHIERLGLTSRSVIGKTREEWLDAHPEVRASADWSIVLDAQREHRPYRNFVYRAPNAPDAQERWFRISGHPVFDSQGVFLGYRGVGSDVTELYLAKARAEEASRTKSMFLANMSHEIRTPMNGVLGMAEVLESALTDPEHKRMISTIRKSGETLLNILNDILDMSKIEAGKMELEEVPFSPVDLAERVEDLHRLMAEEKGLDFEVLVSTGAETRRMGDPFRVQQILHNLVSNAIKFTDRGEVTVEVSGRRGTPLVLEVRDTGIGMSPQEIERLHEEFRQADSSVTRRFGGTGLGMSITRTLVQRMGGDITVTSEPGVGTTIRITLPLPVAEIAPEAPMRAPAAAVEARLDGLRILAADDNGTNRSVLELMLTRCGAIVTTVEDGLQAVTAWEPGKFDVVLLDIAMPVMDGKAALEAIRGLEAATGAARVPIIAVTANAMSHQIVEYVIWGFDSCVSKPLTMADMIKAITSLLPSS
ncbi:PAS domain-containing protein [Rhodobacter sp. HX-7-19]|uniref:Sensory/regulatory protein RpfC n=1 Tax=Paragemmobacter kunshanensis TaxID=2583234 RepID=A0A6M1U0S9_9RHOB|nr:hybrid sensor histidine kinase/response regulator [Rhodobacter kunshanensis]NGQ89655.1 PAS domain-containing protein [Rhodobacter kunshanensis]